MPEDPNKQSGDELARSLGESRQLFLREVASLRPELHRYCARMLGSVIDAEDMVQETLARGYYKLSELETIPPLRPWLFRIAHNCTLDFLRGYERRMSSPLEESPEIQDKQDGPGVIAERKDAVMNALSRYLKLPPSQRSCAILKEVFGYSLEEIAELLDLTVPAVKSALTRARETLAASETSNAPFATPFVPSPALVHYAELFNARDWENLRALLVEDVKLDLVSKATKRGKTSVGSYFTNYASIEDWKVIPARLESWEGLAFFPSKNSRVPAYFICVKNDRGGGVTRLRDYRYVPYILLDASIELARLR